MVSGDPVQPSRSPQPIGSWRFHTEPPPGSDADPLELVVTAAATTANSLDESGLMHSRTLTVPAWVRLRGGVPSKADVPPLSLTITAPVRSDALSAELRAHAVSSGEPDAVPPYVDIAGPGEIAENRHGDLMGVSVVYDGLGATVSVHTYSDVWLPYNLFGEAQSEIAAVHSPRLAGALRRLAAELGTQVDPGEPTRYAEPVEDGLVNHRDANGEIIATSDW